MNASQLLASIARTLDATADIGPEAHLGGMVHELRLVQADLLAILADLDAATDDVARLRAMHRWNDSAQWGELLVTTLHQMLEQPMPT